MAKKAISGSAAATAPKYLNLDLNVLKILQCRFYYDLLKKDNNTFIFSKLKSVKFSRVTKMLVSINVVSVSEDLV